RLWARGGPIIAQVWLAIVAGAPTVLIGPNGAGKTTLLRLAMGLVHPTRGSVTWGGRREAPPTRRAIVFQRPVMLRRSTSGNLRYALDAAGVGPGARAARVRARPQPLGLSRVRAGGPRQPFRRRQRRAPPPP